MASSAHPAISMLVLLTTSASYLPTLPMHSEAPNEKRENPLSPYPLTLLFVVLYLLFGVLYLIWIAGDAGVARIPYEAGRLVGTLIPPTLLYLLIGRFSRSRIAANVVFVGGTLFAIVAGVGIPLMAQRVRDARNVAELQQSERDMRSALAEADSLEEMASAANESANKMIGQLEAVGNDSDSEAARSARAMAKVLRSFYGRQTEHQAFCAELGARLSPEAMAEPGASRATREMAGKAASMAGDLLELFLRMPEEMRKELKAEGLSERQVEVQMRAALKNEAEWKWSERLLRRSSDLARATEVLVVHLDDNIGNWFPEDGMYMFSDDAALERFNELLGEVQAIDADMQRLAAEHQALVSRGLH